MIRLWDIRDETNWPHLTLASNLNGLSLFFSHLYSRYCTQRWTFGTPRINHTWLYNSIEIIAMIAPLETVLMYIYIIAVVITRHLTLNVLSSMLGSCSNDYHTLLKTYLLQRLRSRIIPHGVKMRLMNLDLVDLLNAPLMFSCSLVCPAGRNTKWSARRNAKNGRYRLQNWAFLSSR